jgi:hypothetical protein
VQSSSRPLCEKYKDCSSNFISISACTASCPSSTHSCRLRSNDQCYQCDLNPTTTTTSTITTTTGTSCYGLGSAGNVSCQIYCLDGKLHGGDCAPVKNCCSNNSAYNPGTYPDGSETCSPDGGRNNQTFELICLP